jgi:hypothetical protein
VRFEVKTYVCIDDKDVEKIKGIIDSGDIRRAEEYTWDCHPELNENQVFDIIEQIKGLMDQELEAEIDKANGLLKPF